MAHSRIHRARFWLLPALLFLASLAGAQSLYKYRGADGEWIYSDRPPADAKQAEVRSLTANFNQPQVSIEKRFVGTGVELVASNSYYAPMEIALELTRVAGVDFPHPDDPLRWVVPARSERVLLHLPVLDTLTPPAVTYRYEYFPGDPSSVADDRAAYRVPYAIGKRFRVTQAPPVATTHTTPDSRNAVDVAMPVGTDVVAARDGVVFDVVHGHFTGGDDFSRFGELANVVRVLHDDGTFAAYAHLNRNTIRVRPGDRLAVGDYIADSGNSGFSSGAHLHFVVQQNVGRRVVSLPVTFRGADGAVVTPVTGTELTAYP